MDLQIGNVNLTIYFLNKYGCTHVCKLRIIIQQYFILLSIIVVISHLHFGLKLYRNRKTIQAAKMTVQKADKHAVVVVSSGMDDIQKNALLS